MDLKSLPIFAAIQKKMDWLNRRQGVLAENVANANTPGYLPKDLNSPNFEGLLSQYSNHGVQLMVTQPGHMRGANATVVTQTEGVSYSGAGAADGSVGGADVKKIKPQEVQPNGNGVTVESEMAKMANTQIEYTTLLDVYRKQVSMLDTVIGKGR